MFSGCIAAILPPRPETASEHLPTSSLCASTCPNALSVSSSRFTVRALSLDFPQPCTAPSNASSALLVQSQRTHGQPRSAHDSRLKARPNEIEADSLGRGISATRRPHIFSAEAPNNTGKDVEMSRGRARPPAVPLLFELTCRWSLEPAQSWPRTRYTKLNTQNLLSAQILTGS